MYKKDKEEKCNCGGYGSFPNPTKPPCLIHMPFLSGQENEENKQESTDKNS